jgi:hypothetical protein
MSKELERTIAPYLKRGDNIAIRYIDDGLPTTCTAVLGSVFVHGGGSGIEYAIRTMIFETNSGRPGCNIHIRPDFRCKTDRAGNITKREKIASPPVYDFREVYENVEQSRDDLARLVKIADNHFRSHH